uniref:Uncharacterized protein n=1 Tax=viral metagenome TaxID=1070528 RepID=A0A6C0CR64_9ZZZZ
MRIVIVGAGWYGLHIYKYLKEMHSDIDVIILEKSDSIFSGSSLNNQNRLHLGYHYPRSHKTRELCKKNYKRFIEEYPMVVENIKNNYYLISKDSIIDYNTYIKIFSNDLMYNHTIRDNPILDNIDGSVINTNEKFISAIKAKRYFKSFVNEEDIKLNYTVHDISSKDDNIIINGEEYCDLLLDCTFNQLGMSSKTYIYELTISLVYKKKSNTVFGALTIMDGNFFSIFPRNIEDNTYTLTHVLYTPIIKSKDINTILKYSISEEKVIEIKDNMEREVLQVYKRFSDDFIYQDYFLSYKCKLISGCDTRECNIEESNKILSVNCGKITGIFNYQDYVEKYLSKLKI